jgi:indole-3-glycerol phosphate synthase
MLKSVQDQPREARFRNTILKGNVQQMSHLAGIVAYKREEIRPWIEHTEDWKRRALQNRHFRGFAAVLSSGSFGFVGEIKKSSPSAGLIAPEFDPAKIAEVYNQAGVDCVSVLTDEKFFQGHLDYLALVRRRIPVPLLRKDFTLHEVQIYQAALAGADAVLLIVAALNESELKHLFEAANELGIDCLVEVHTETELERALQVKANLIGINNRDLTDFATDLAVTERLAPLIPDSCTVLSESGIKTPEDVRRVASTGVDAALIGEALMRADDPKGLLQAFAAAVSDATQASN